MRRLLLIACAAGCSFIFDPNAPVIRLEGKAPPPPPGPHVPWGGGNFYLLRGADGDPWIVFYSSSSLSVPSFQPNQPPEPLNELRVARLAPPVQDETFTGNEIHLRDQRLYVRTGTQLRVRQIGTPGEHLFSLPPGDGRLGPAADAFYYLPADADHLLVARSDGSFSRTLAVPLAPAGGVGIFNQSLLFAAGDTVLVDVQRCSFWDNSGCVSIVAHSTTEERDVDLGWFSVPPTLETNSLLSCDAGGLRRVYFDGSVEIFDSAACDGGQLVLPNRILSCGSAGLRERLPDGTIRLIDAGPCDRLRLVGGTNRGRPFSWYITHRNDLESQPMFVCAKNGFFLVPADSSPPRLLDAGACESDFGLLLLDEAALLCKNDGLRLVRYDGVALPPLDGARCSSLLNTGEDFVWRPGAEGFALQVQHGDIWYARLPPAHTPRVLDEPVWAVPFDGSAPPRVIIAPDGHKRLMDPLGLLPPIYSLDASFSLQISDAWLDGWQFMERGFDLHVSFDRTRLHWIDHAARIQPVGDLMSATLSSHEILPLARNVRQYQEVGVGKLLVADNQPSVSSQNRIILVDEAARTARWVVDAADRFGYLFPGDVVDDPQLLVELISDSNEKSLALLPFTAP